MYGRVLTRHDDGDDRLNWSTYGECGWLLMRAATWRAALFMGAASLQQGRRKIALFHRQTHLQARSIGSLRY
jgi:hypothetical protein